jgi:hypothetical protein
VGGWVDLWEGGGCGPGDTWNMEGSAPGQVASGKVCYTHSHTGERMLTHFIGVGHAAVHIALDAP